MLVSINGAAPIKTPERNPSYGDLQEGTPNFRNPLISTLLGKFPQHDQSGFPVLPMRGLLETSPRRLGFKEKSHTLLLVVAYP